MSLDVVIRGGQVVTPSGIDQWEIGIAGEKIAAIATPGSFTNDVGQFIDAAGQLVIPGGIDPHVHSYWAMPQADGSMLMTAPPIQASRAAVFGGTTTLIDFAKWDPTLGLMEAISRDEEVWRDSYTDYAHHVMLRDAIPPNIVEEIPEAISAGYPSFKIYTTNIRPRNAPRDRSLQQSGLMSGMGHVWAVMEQLAQHGGVLSVHAEDDDIVMFMYDKLAREGRTALENMPLAHPAISEDMSFRRIIRLARHVEGAAVYMVHVSAKEGVDAIAEARADGYPVYGETLHHYATFTADMYQRPDGVIYHTYPSLKHEEDRKRLWQGLRSGALNTVATDEVCTPRAIKVQDPTIFGATGGHVGVETRLSVIYTEGVSKRDMPLERFVAVTSTNAAKLFGLYPRKGVIAPGSDADLVIFDPQVRKTLRLEDLHGSDYSAWEGWEVHGWPSLTMLRGKVMVKDGQLLGKPGDGHRVIRKLLPAILNGPAVA